MNRNIFALLLGAYLLIVPIAALPLTLNLQIPTELKAATETEDPPTAFQRETHDFIQTSWSKIVKNAMTGIRVLVNNTVNELSAQQNQTAALQKHLTNLTNFLIKEETFESQPDLILDEPFWNKTNELLTPLLKYMKNDTEKTAEEQHINDIFDSYGRETLVKSVQDKVEDLEEQVFNRLQSHFDVLLDDVAMKERDFYNLYWQFTVAGTKKNRMVVFYRHLFTF